ncbi:MAG: hypothetical protein WCX73_01185 [Candidatus Pacearchaeota archaeon]|jgi:hypothetical protein
MKEKSLKNKIITWGLIGISSLTGLFNVGCGPGVNDRMRNYKTFYNTDLDKLSLCNCKYPNGYYTDRGPLGYMLNVDVTQIYENETDPANLEVMKEKCKEGIIAYGEVPNENFVEQGKNMYRKFNAPIFNRAYSPSTNLLFFNKQDFPERYAVSIDTLKAARLNDQTNEWEYDAFMTKWARSNQEVFKAVDELKASQVARYQNNNQNTQISEDPADSPELKEMRGRVGGNLATVGLLGVLAN